MRLKDKVALITGASNGMGAAEAQLFAGEGATVIAMDIDVERGEVLSEKISKSGALVEFHECDVTNESDWNRVTDYVMAKYGSIDVLVNNAGISSGITEDHLDTSAWDKIMAVNSTSVYLGTKIAAEIMKSQGRGSIVNISSIMGFIGGLGHPAYNASKGSVRIFTKAAAVRYGPFGVRVNSVHPGFMPPMKSSSNSSSQRMRDQRRILAEETPLRRTGEVMEVAYGVLFLSSDEASFVTGTELVIDGGYIAR